MVTRTGGFVYTRGRKEEGAGTLPILVVRDRLNAFSGARELATPQRLNIGSPTFLSPDTTRNHPLRTFS